MGSLSITDLSFAVAGSIPALRIAGMRVAYIHTHMISVQHTSASIGVIIDWNISRPFPAVFRTVGRFGGEWRDEINMMVEMPLPAGRPASECRLAGINWTDVQIHGTHAHG